MKTNTICKAVIFLFLSVTFSLAGHIENGKAKADALRDLAQNSPDGIIKFNSTGYNYFLAETPRPYEVVIFFTAPKCEFCEEMYKQYQQAAQINYQNNGHIAVHDPSKKLRAVFYGVMTFEQNVRDVFLDLEFKSVPNLLVSIPKHALVSDSERSNFLKGFKWSISGSDGLVTFHKVLEYVNKRTGRDIEYQTPLLEVVSGLCFFLLLVVLTIILFRVFKPFFLNTKLWFVGSLVIYFVCIAGVVYNIIHDVPMTIVNKKGETEWMVDNQRTQIGAEGFVMSGLFSLTALCIIIWHAVATKLNTKKMLQQLVMVSLFGLAFILVCKIEELYLFKGWYTIQFFPPTHYNQGPLMKDQGNSI